MLALPDEVAGSLTPEALASLAETLRAFPRYLQVRGGEYARGGRVWELTREGEGFRAKVQGSRSYLTRWRHDDPRWAPTCSCLSGPWCKHAFGTGLLVIAAARRSGRFASDALDGLFSTDWLPEVAPPPATAPGAGREPATSHSRRHARSPIQTLRDGLPWERHHAALALLREAGLDAFAMPGTSLHELTSEADADLRCLLLARSIAARPNHTMPESLKPYLDNSELESRFEERQRREVLESLDRWSRASAEAPRRLRLVVGLELDPEGTVGVTLQTRLTAARAHDAPQSSSQLDLLTSDLRRDPTLLTPPQARLLRMLVSTEFRHLFLTSNRPARLRGAQITQLLDRGANSPFVAWDEELPETLAASCGVKPGDRIRVADVSLTLGPLCVRVEGELRLGLVLSWPDGKQLPLTGVVRIPGERGDIGGPASHVLTDGLFYTVEDEPPAEVLRALGDGEGLALRRDDRGVLEHLAERFTSVREAMQPFTRMIEADPIVCLDLREDDWLRVRLFAHAGTEAFEPTRAMREAEVLFEWSPGAGWERVQEMSDAAGATSISAPEDPTDPEAAARAAAEAAEDVALDAEEAAAANEGMRTPEAGVAMTETGAAMPGTGAAMPEASTGEDDASSPPWVEAPVHARVEPALEWLAMLREKSGPRRGPAPEGTGQWLRLTPRTAEGLIEAWETRPQGVRWFGNRSAQRLLDGARLVRANVRVSASGIDWFEVSADWEAEGLALTPQDLARLRTSRERMVRLASGWVRRETAEAYDATAATLADLGLEPGTGPQRISVWQLAQARPENLDALERMGIGDDARAQLSAIRARVRTFRGLPNLPAPADLSATLRPYQHEGFEFLSWTTSLGLGAILADDMGLGKTVQALAWLLHERAKAGPDAGPALVVCPASVVHNWLREASRFSPGLRAIALESGTARHALRERASEYDLLVTNYTLLRRDAAMWRELPLFAAILDEAQNIKNPAAAVTRAALSLQAKYRMALTGTPLENRALDLWSIASFVNPGHLGSQRTFVERYDGPDAPPHVRQLLSARLRPILLRRLKSQVAQELPPRIEERQDCEMTPGQRKLYLAELTRARQLVRGLSDEEGGLQAKRFEVLASLTRLRQICCHPALAGGKRALGSGKFDALFELLDELLAEGHKVLLFSQFVQCLELLREDLKEKNIPYHWLTGETTNRGSVVEAFEKDERPCVFLLSLKAGGTGLNLTAASHVVLFDPWWNPAVEAQAIDRTHRIGQTRTVIAFRMLTQNTVEERIFELQQRKSELARGILGEESFARSITRTDLEHLLGDVEVAEVVEE
jgi:superfamily II DNA or RNA helicase